jgi:hypothetical protein
VGVAKLAALNLCLDNATSARFGGYWDTAFAAVKVALGIEVPTGTDSG